MVFPSASLCTEPSPAMDLILAHLNLKLSSAFISPLASWKVPPFPPCRHLKYFSYYYVFKPGCLFSGVFFCKRQLCIKHPLDLHVTENFNFTPVCPVFPDLTEMQGEAAGKCLVQLCLQPWGCNQNHLKIFETFSLWIDFLPKKFEMGVFEDRKFPPLCVTIQSYMCLLQISKVALAFSLP